jgi:hypothetical protein
MVCFDVIEESDEPLDPAAVPADGDDVRVVKSGRERATHWPREGRGGSFQSTVTRAAPPPKPTELAM